MKNKKEVSVILVNYNDGAFIEQAIDSLLTQTFPSEHFEIIVVDDASTDDSCERLKHYEKKIFLIKLSQNIGSVKASNIGFEAAWGRFVVKVDADDWCESKMLEKLFNALKRKPSAVFSYCDYFEVDRGHNKRIYLENSLFHSIACAVMFDRKMLRDFGCYDEALVLPEYDLLFKVSNKFEGVHVKEPLYYYRRHPGSLTTRVTLMEEALRQLEERHGKIQGLREIISPYAKR